MKGPWGMANDTEQIPSAEAIREACMLWQSGRDEGSSPLRAAARIVTETRHYFEAPFIDEFERQARESDKLQTLAKVLLADLANAPRRTARQWGESLGIDAFWAGRGTSGGTHAPQIRASIKTGQIAMPLWGVSLSETVAAGYGEQFTFEILGAFPAIIASQHSALKTEELELITGGRYAVERTRETEEGGLITSLRYVDSVPVVR